MIEEHKRLVKLTWQQRVKAISQYHASRCKDDENHTLEDTAKELNRSIGRISDDLQLASWMKTHPRVEKFKNPTQALGWIRDKKKEMRIADA